METSSDLINLSNLDGLSAYDRFDTIRSIIGQAMATNDPQEIHRHYAEVMLNMMLMKVSLYTDQDADALHFFSDYQMFLAYIKDAVDYITARYKELTNTSSMNNNDTIDLIQEHYEEYMSHHAKS